MPETEIISEERVSSVLRLDVKERMPRLRYHAENCANRTEAEFLFRELMQAARAVATIWEFDHQLKSK